MTTNLFWNGYHVAAQTVDDDGMLVSTKVLSPKGYAAWQANREQQLQQLREAAARFQARHAAGAN